ncbi:MAG TPA: class I SAM-dependent methyltransferase [Nitrososphaera sp.]|nr:class I SAM-dependent methyltransferase [Nitrososphaera sp.]
MASWQSIPVLVNRRLLFAGIFLIALSGLVLEVSITRIFSAAIWYHFAFVAVSVALVGLGASGLVVQHRVKKLKGKWAENLTIYSAWGIAIFIPITLFVMHALASQVIYLPLFMILFSVPFFLVGIIISAAFNAFASVAGRLYAADLIGASAGALLVVLFLVLTGGEGATLIVGLIAAISGTIFSRIAKNTKKTVVSLMFVAFALSLIFLNHATQIFAIPTDPTAQKDLPIYLREHPGSKIVKTEWNSFSRIDVVEGGAGGEGLVAKVFIDGGAGTNIISWDGKTESRQELSTWMQYLPFKMMQDPKVLVIGSGGGRDVVASLVSGSKDVTSVEINPIIYETVKSYGDRAGNVYSHEYVRSYVDEGRSFITRSSEKYDIVYVPFVDTWASVSSGGLSVSENFLYTLQGFQQYYDHLTDTGKIVTVRWLIDAPRFISTYAKLLEQNGIPQDQLDRHLIMVTSDSYTQDPSVTMVIFSKSPFTDEEIRFFSQSFSQYGYKPILVPGQIMREPYSALLNGQINLDQFYNMFETKVYPVTDDNPYFLSFEKPLPGVVEVLLYVSVGIVAIFLLVPFAWMKRRREEEVGTKRSEIGIATMIPYFAALGMGFILIELALLQKLILLMGNPTMTFALLLFTLLISSGAGSLLSARIAKNNMKNLVFIIGGIAGLGILYFLFLPPIIYSTIAEPIEAKAAVSIAILAPIGFLMGMPLPTGMRLLKVHRPDYIPWMWAVNGAFSVLGAVLAIALGIMYGSSLAMILGILIYLVALGISFASKKKTITQVAT